jgi:hypothetical protein
MFTISNMTIVGNLIALMNKFSPHDHTNWSYNAYLNVSWNLRLGLSSGTSLPIKRSAGHAVT